MPRLPEIEEKVQNYGMKSIIIVTGASSGMGREFALQLAKTRKTQELWLIARRTDKLEDLSREIARIPGAPDSRILPMDLSADSGLAAFNAALAAEAAAAGPAGGLFVDTLVNNAGFGTYGTFADTDLGRQLEMVKVNVYALTALCHDALPYLGKGSRVINVASLAAFAPLGNFAVYGATKAYALSFSLAFAAEVADRGILVSAVCPGPVDTEFANVASNGARTRVVDGKDPVAVVAHSLRAAERGKPVAVMAPKWKFKAFMSRFIGRYFFARHTYLHEKRPSAPVR